MLTEPSALVLLSGGIDSTVLLYYVMEVLGYPKVEAILFDYGQRHKIELGYAQKLVYEVLSIHWTVIEVDLTQFGGSSLVSDDKDLPVVVPARNSIFLSLAAACAETRGLQDIFIGTCAEDFKDFPDCREEFIQLMSQALSMGNNIRGVYAPFVNRSKQEIVKIGRLMGVPFELTWSCYNPIRSQGIAEVVKNYKPCGKCHACIERNKVL